MSNVVPMRTGLQPGTWTTWRDTFANFLSSLGIIGRDKNASGVYVQKVFTKLDLETAYRGDWIIRKAIDIPPFDSTRQWRQWKADEQQIELLEETEKTSGVQRKLQMALTKARLYGGSVIIIGCDDRTGTMDKPLDVEKIGQGDLRFLHVLTRWGISPAGRRIDDLSSPWFGEPEYYERRNGLVGSDRAMMPLEMSAGNLRIHPSRVIRLNGLDHPDEDTALEIWGDSVINIIDDAVRAAGTVHGSIAALISEAKVDIINVPNLTEIFSSPAGTKKLVDRFQGVNEAKSIINSILLDGEEKWQRLGVTFTGMPDVMQMYLLIVCGAVDIPATRFLGQSPVGMNATGESDTRNYYDRLKSDQTTRTTPVMSPLDEILIRTTFGSRDKAIWYEWSPLWQLSEKEKADIAYVKAQSVQIDFNTALIPESALAKGRQNQVIEDGLYPGIEQAIEEADAAGEFAPHDPEQQVEAAAEEAKQQEQQFGLQQQAVAAKTSNVVPIKKKVGDRFVRTLKGRLKDKHTNQIIAQDAEPRTLYVHRDLLNSAEFTKWAKSQGFTDIIDDLHVTIIYSKEAVDWIKMGNSNEYGFDGDKENKLIVPAGGPRVIEELGTEGAVVLFFASSRLTWRHQDMVYKGASYDYEDYMPHVTITYDKGNIDLTKVEPYRGALEFGPEIFEEIKQPGPDDENTP